MFDVNKLPNQLASGTWGGSEFALIHNNNEVQLYWDDGEYSVYPLHSGLDPKEVAEKWKAEILDQRISSLEAYHEAQQCGASHEEAEQFAEEFE